LAIHIISLGRGSRDLQIMTQARKPRRADRGLASARAKVDRAKKHLRDLEAAWRAFVEDHPDAIGLESDLEAVDKTRRLALREDPPYELSLIAGDAIHNLHCALDHLAVAAVCKGGTTDINAKSTKVRFPTTADPNEFPARLTKDVHGAPLVALAVFERLEPYPGGRGWWLHAINALDNIDKHDLVLNVEPYVWGKVMLRGRKGGPFEGHLTTAPISPRPAKHGHDIFPDPSGKSASHFDQDFQLTMAPFFNQRGVLKPEPVLPFLMQLVDLTERVIDLFWGNVFGGITYTITAK
jgi:hypothetical protein